MKKEVKKKEEEEDWYDVELKQAIGGLLALFIVVVYIFSRENFNSAFQPEMWDIMMGVVMILMIVLVLFTSVIINFFASKKAYRSNTGDET
jgi:hypothetical protein